MGDEFEVLVTDRDWMNGPGRGTLLLMGLEHSHLIAAVKRMSPDNYRLKVKERKIRTGTVDENDQPVFHTKVTIVRLEVKRIMVPNLVHMFKDRVDHRILKEERFRRYEADRRSTELDDDYYGNSASEVRAFAKSAKTFAYKLSKIPVAKRRKEAVRAIIKQFDAVLFENTNESGIMPTDRNEDFLMYSAYLGVLNLIRGDCPLMKYLATLVFSEDTSCEFRISTLTYSLYYPSRRQKRIICVDLSETLRAEMQMLHRIRGKQGTIQVFINPNKRGPMTYNALTKWAARYSKKNKKK